MTALTHFFAHLVVDGGMVVVDIANRLWLEAPWWLRLTGG